MPIIGVLNRELDEVGLTTLPRGVILSVPPEILLPGLHLYACVRVCPDVLTTMPTSLLSTNLLQQTGIQPLMANQ